MEQSGLAGRLALQRMVIARSVAQRVLAQWPDRAARDGRADLERCVRDLHAHLPFFEQALALGSQGLLSDCVAWVRSLLVGRGWSEGDLARHWPALLAVASRHLSAEDAGVVEAAFDHAFATLPDLVPASALPPDGAAGRFLQSLREQAPDEAAAFVFGLADTGMPLQDIYLHVLQPSQQEIGRLWETGAIGVAEEHYCTAVTQLVMAQLYPRVFSRRPRGPRVVVACVPGELHEMGARMVADILQLEGFDTDFLGANLPTHDLVDFVARRRPGVVGLSTTIAPHLGRAQATIQALRSDPRTAGVKIVVGGYPYNRVAGLWQRLGADAFASDAQDAARIVRELSGTTT